MRYPSLSNTPIREIVFSLSYSELVDKDCFKKFINVDSIKKKFIDIKPSIDQKFNINNGKIEVDSIENGVHLKNENEVLQLKKGSLSYHYLNGYKEYSKLLASIVEYWKIFDEVTKDTLTITNYSVRYINLIEIDKENKPTHLVQLYPKQSFDKEVINFQNSVQFKYNDKKDYTVNAVSTRLKDNNIVLDISVNGEIKDITKEKLNFEKLFEPLRELKNRAFFDSITARALIKYI